MWDKCKPWMRLIQEKERPYPSSPLLLYKIKGKGLKHKRPHPNPPLKKREGTKTAPSQFDYYTQLAMKPAFTFTLTPPLFSTIKS